MTRLAATVLATAVALAMVGGATFGAVQPAQGAPDDVIAASEPVAPAMDLGRCQIRYDELAEANQPMPMECEHATWIARRWGGAVVEQTAEGLIERARFDGPNRFDGVPASALPRAGWCRVWIDGVDASAQPEETDCRAARTIADTRGGRVLYMPL